MHQRNQAKIVRDNIHKNSKILDLDYKVRDKIMLNNNADFRYETRYNGSF